MSPLSCPGNVLCRKGSLAWFAPERPLGGICRLLFTTRLGGLSQGPFAHLNLGFHVGDVPERVRLNRLRVREAGLPGLLDPVCPCQTHGTGVRHAGVLHAGANWQTPEGSLPDTDALVTSLPGLPLMIQVADCLAVAVVDPVRRVVGVAHAGWRGLAAGVLEATLAAMEATWGADPGDCVAWLGPAIGPCCYEVGPEVAGLFPDSVRPTGDRALLDLRDAAARSLTRAGLPASGLEHLALCTCCHEDLCFSHRRTVREGHASTGRQALFAWIDPL